MSFERPRASIVKRLTLTLAFLILFGGALADFYQRYQYDLHKPLSAWPPTFFPLSAFILAVAVIALLGLWQPGQLAFLGRLRSRLGWSRWPLIAALSAFTSWFFLFSPWSEILGGVFLRLYVLLAITALLVWLATRSAAASFDWPGLLAAILLLGTIFVFASALQGVSDYPFSQTWSEGNRLWDYSIFYGRYRYEYPADLPIRVYTDRCRQNLWGLPFLFTEASISGLRLWSGLVFTIPYALLGWFIFRPQPKKLASWFLCGLWAFLFLYQGPIYSPLVLAAILVAAAARRPLWIAILLVGLAGYYVRFCRVNWMFAPAMWAAMVALVEVSPYAVRTFSQRWGRAISLGLAGLAGSILLPQLVKLLQPAATAAPSASQNVLSAEGLTHVLTWQPFLWERLWPNPTNPLGIVLELLLAAGPLVMLLVSFAVLGRWRLDPWQKLALIGVQAAFLVVGLVVSVKIGGGSNLHNLDMLLIGLLFAAGLAWEAGAEKWILSPPARPWWLRLVILFMVAYPATQGILEARPLGLPSQVIVDDALEQTRQAVAEAKTQGEVLFIDQRQLLTFGYIQDVPLVPDYEKKYLMDQAMAENQAFFDKFYDDLASHRFSLIISEPLWVRFQGDVYHFGNENDAWVKWVSQPLLCYYEPVETNLSVGVQLLTPRREKQAEADYPCPSN